MSWSEIDFPPVPQIGDGRARNADEKPGLSQAHV
jgi:hypothetical protein